MSKVSTDAKTPGMRSGTPHVPDSTPAVAYDQQTQREATPAAHPHRLGGSHDKMYVTEHHRGARRKG